MFDVVIFTTASLESAELQFAVAAIIYRKMLLLAPGAGIKVPDAALKTPATPEMRLQVPPLCSPVIMEKRSTGIDWLLQIETLPSFPANEGPGSFKITFNVPLRLHPPSLIVKFIVRVPAVLPNNILILLIPLPVAGAKLFPPPEMLHK